jgi:hypothetical protein
LKIAGTSNLAGAATLGSTLGVTGAATLSSTLAVTGASTFTGAIQGNSTLTTTGAIQGNSTLAITGTSTLGNAVTISAGGLTVTGPTLLNNTLQAVQAVTMDSTLAVSGTSTFSDNITLNTAKRFTCGNLYIENNKIASTSTAGSATDLVIDVNTGNKVHITGDLQVDGSFNFLGSVTQTNVNINVTDELFITSEGPLPTMVALQNNNASDIAGFYYDSSASTPVMVIGKDNAVCVNKATASSGIAFDVSGASQFSGKMSLLNDLSLNGAAVINGTTNMKSLVTASAGLTVSSGAVNVTTGDVTIAAGKLTVSTGLTEIQALDVNTTSNFDGIATFNAGIVLGATFIDQW